MNQQTSNKIFVGGLNYDTVDNALLSTFSKFGKVVDHFIVKFRKTGDSRGFGYVKFSSLDEAELALSSQPIVIDGKTVELRRATPEVKLNQQKKIVLRGLTQHITHEDIEKYFSEFGKVNNVDQLISRDDRRKQGYGFVEFENDDALTKATLTETHTIKGRDIFVHKVPQEEEMKQAKKSMVNRNSYLRGIENNLNFGAKGLRARNTLDEMKSNVKGSMGWFCRGGNVCGGGSGDKCAHGCRGWNQCGGGYGQTCGHGETGKGGWGGDQRSAVSCQVDKENANLKQEPNDGKDGLGEERSEYSPVLSRARAKWNLTNTPFTLDLFLKKVAGEESVNGGILAKS